MNTKLLNKAILAYSGGLDTSAIIPWIKENYNLQVIAFVANIGQSEEDLKSVKQKAFNSGADGFYMLDLRHDFLCNYIYPLIHTGAIYEDNYLLGTSISRPIIAKTQVDLAIQLNAKFLCHGSTGKGNDQVRFELVYTSLAPDLEVLAPWRKWNFSSREDLLEYLKLKNIATSATVEKIYSRDDNIWHTSTEGGRLEDPWNAPTNDCWVRTVDPIIAPDEPEYLSIEITQGIVTVLNGVSMTPVECLEKLNYLGSIHGIGRIDIVENRLIGMKSRGCYETPGGTIIVKALRAIEELVLDRDSRRWRSKLALNMSYLVYDGHWFSPCCESIRSAVSVFTKLMNGEVILKLYKGSVMIIQKRSDNSLYSQKLSTFSTDKIYQHVDATGFIRLYSLPARTRAVIQNKLNNE
ncbi:MAG: argininosuccinate synthase [Buchnera aphidicola (Eriosoma harunire)]